MIRGTDEAEYRALVADFPPRPIHTREQLAATEARIEELLTLSVRTPAQDDYLDLLSDLVRAWEDAHVDIPRLSGIEVLRVLCEERGLRQRDLVPIFGTPSLVSEVLSGKRELQRKHIEALSAFLNVSPAVFFPASPAPRLAPPRAVAGAARG
jgi:HTH-type transcriptional regulator/antitoxin HigA